MGPAFQTALIVGGGIAGMSAALSLHDAGVDVHLIDQDPEWRVYGAGITITGPTLRVMKRLGILEDVLAHSWTADGILACDKDGNLLSKIETDDGTASCIPGAGGIMRPMLHNMLSQRVRASAIKVSLGVTVTEIAPGRPKVVSFSDGTTATYDLVVGSDGIFSATRALIFPDAEPPKYVGQICWRLMTKRHDTIDRRTYFLGGQHKIGMNPVSPDEMYMFLLEPSQTADWIPDEELYPRLRTLMASYQGLIAEVRETLTPESNIVARPLETAFLPDPWFKDDVLLIGDAAHASTPQLASGAGMAMEDGVVLGECASREQDLDGVLSSFMARRFGRCALVVNKSLSLGRLERDGASPFEQIKVVEAALAELNQPY